MSQHEIDPCLRSNDEGRKMFATAVFLDEVLRDYNPVGVFNFFMGHRR